MEFKFNRIDVNWLLDMAIAGIEKCGVLGLDERQLAVYFSLRNALLFDESGFVIKVD